MNQSNWQEIKSLLWIAIGQTSQKRFQVDAETLQFFTPNKKSIPQSKKKETITTQEIIEQTCSPIPLEQTHQLKKLLPQAKELSKIDVEQTLMKIHALKNPPKLVQSHLYPEPKIEKKKIQYAFFLHIENEHELFIKNVFQAMHSRLQIAVHTYSCNTCAIYLPLALAEYDRVIFVLDQHKKSHVLHALESLDGFSSQTLIKPPLPFTVLGTLHTHPIIALILHQQSHEDPKFKGQLWLVLQELAKGEKCSQK